MTEPNAHPLNQEEVGASEPARQVIDGYHTLFAEIAAEQLGIELLLVPVGVGSLGRTSEPAEMVRAASSFLRHLSDQKSLALPPFPYPTAP